MHAYIHTYIRICKSSHTKIRTYTNKNASMRTFIHTNVHMYTPCIYVHRHIIQLYTEIAWLNYPQNFNVKLDFKPAIWMYLVGLWNFAYCKAIICMKVGFNLLGLEAKISDLGWHYWGDTNLKSWHPFASTIASKNTHFCDQVSLA